VHRDVKPSNILLEEGIERALLTDFGLARAADDASLTHTGYLPGTPHYMSPEQARGESVDGRSDLFSLGSVMYAMCTGRPPFRADTSFGVLRRITDTKPRSIREVNPDVPTWLAGLVEKLLAKEPGDRFASASELAALLEQCLAHVQQPSAVPLPAACKVRAHRFRNTRVVLAIATLVLAAALGGIYWAKIANRDQSSASDKNGSSAAAESLSDLDWNAAADEIKTLSEDLDALNERVGPLWDRQPAPPSDGASNQEPGS